MYIKYHRSGRGSSGVTVVAHLKLILLNVALVEEVGVEEGHSLSVAVLVVLVIDHLLVQLLALYVAHVHRPQLLADYILLYDNFGCGGEEEEAHQQQFDDYVA